MKKETLIAVFFGIILGGVVAFLIIVKSKDIQLANNKAIAPKDNNINAVGQPLNVSFQTLEVSSPQDRVIVDKNSITIIGKVEKNSLLVIQSPIKDMVVVADKNDYSIDFPLSLGENAIKITAYPKDQTLKPQEKNLSVYYLDSQL